MDVEKQKLRNALSRIEDVAREIRYSGLGTEAGLANLIAQLAQIIRQDIVK